MRRGREEDEEQEVEKKGEKSEKELCTSFVKKLEDPTWHAGKTTTISSIDLSTDLSI